MRFQLLAFLAILAFAPAAPAQTVRSATRGVTPVALPAPPPGVQCRLAIAAAERANLVPPMLMAAIGRVESGRIDARGVMHPWPWTINAEGAGQYFDSKDAALAAVRSLQAKGVRSIDVGCMQVNLAHHPDAFASLDQAFDPTANARYAGRFLTALFARTGTWSGATEQYHSATRELGEAYGRRVAAVWPEEQRRGPGAFALHQANVWSVNVFSANAWNTAGRRAPGSQLVPSRPAGTPMAAATGIRRTPL